MQLLLSIYEKIGNFNFLSPLSIALSLEVNWALLNSLISCINQLCKLSSVYRPVPSTIWCHPTSLTSCYLPPAIYPYAIYHLPSIICRNPTTILLSETNLFLLKIIILRFPAYKAVFNFFKEKS